MVDLVPVLNEILAISALCAVLYVGGNQVYDKELKPQELMTFLFALFSIMSPIAQLTNTPAVIQKGIVAAETVFDIIDQQPTVKNGNTSIHTFTSSISVDNLHFLMMVIMKYYMIFILALIKEKPLHWLDKVEAENLQ